MNGGNNEYSYSKNSHIQRNVAEKAKSILVSGIIDNLDIENSSSSSSLNKFTIADLGCSTGPNTFISVENIIEAIRQKFKILPEIQVYFNDHVSNDFNALFFNLPSSRNYFACGVGGSFHGRLFPKGSINFVYSAFALQWLSKVPSELNCGVCNGGRIHYGNAPKEVCDAYYGQYERDMISFFDCRAEEVAPAGLMAFLVPGRPDEALPSQFSLSLFLQILESCLVDMADEGEISKEKLESFNMPLYSPSIEELRRIIDKNGKFSIVKLEAHEESIKMLSSRSCRSGFESIISKHFGGEIIEQLFKRYDTKFAQHYPIVVADCTSLYIFVLLKRHL
ncbi:loganic acid O-methyltransferase-like [Mercurialis annua]|uniref:loganic acid O-methyltransferase-like n=1 Tax=Mercurialis annua TaxID=3986 RepID=UPI00216106F2|nr:loganic acid O-methyltransferase-like [Mercurialis annua]